MNFEIHKRSKPTNSKIKYNKSFLLRKRMFRESKNFDSESKIVCRFTTVSGSTKSENERRFADFVDERRFIDSAIASVEGENERLFTGFANFDPADDVKNRRLLIFNNFNSAD